MKLMVGCPVYRRDWILPKWYEHVEKACEEVGVEPVYAFAADLSDEYTYTCLVAHADMYDRAVIIKPIEEDTKREEKREWNDSRIAHMVYVRNSLLRLVRRYKPDQFLSLDSDILLSPKTLTGMYELIDDYAAVGGKVYLSKAGTQCPSYAMLRQGRMRRESDVPYVKRADVIMAAKMMNPCAYDIDYRFHYNGEDIGWSQAIGEAGLTMAHDGRNVSKHIWGESFLDVYDRRVGY